MQVKEVMVEPSTIDKADTVSYALDMMEKKKSRRLLVTHNSEIVGILTMRNLTKELGTRKKYGLPASALHVATAVSDNFVKVFPDTELDDAVTLMAKNKGIIIVADQENILGWITPVELLKNGYFEGYAAEVMEADPILATPSDRVVHIRRLILDNDIGRLPVVENGELVGIVTERDIAKAMRAFRDLVAGNQQDSRIKNLIVEDIMTIGVKTVYTNTPLQDVVDLMLEENIGGLPVLNLENEFVGFITRRNIVNTLVK
ncbi:CBS domain containing membrane protein [Methanosalsum zhilinae DSM 4017]|uniref:CBS domain containing membrane protein n=1 Tax=Methanosalsum zhilinae (strain DSM 4017 / NBRC 107636 / OCM 62 / WeN5) TaxID=679901 RepID=F7XMH6_METZD|nr:CBS domain-containing protein [Methanosalsum zhilinae]AEH59899.1 CBS domain containing membrane protein [Methanosalsum zhilinae DSM 4017]